MQAGQFIQIQEELPITHYFTYKGKNFQFNFDFFKYYSKYFTNNLSKIQSEQYIPLLDKEQEEKVDLSEESIRNFIDFVHRQQILLTDDNLNYLAKKYDVSLLVKATDNYISVNHNALVLQLLTLYQNDPEFEQEQYEDLISKNLLDYINDDRLLSLNFPVLHRIVDKFLIENEKNENEEENDRLMNFLFRCLDKFGQIASVLFTRVNFCNERVKHLNSLLSDYDGKFDFSFVNSNFLRRIYQNQSQLFQSEEKNRLKNNELAKSFEDEFSRIKTEHEQQLNEQKNRFEKEIEKVRKEIEQVKEEKNQQLNEQKSKFDDELNKVRREIEQVKKEKNLQLDEQKRKFEDEMSQIKNENAELKSKVQLLIDQNQKFNGEFAQIRDEITKTKTDFLNKQNEISIKEEQNRLKNNELEKKVEAEFSRIKTENDRQLNEQKSKFEEEINKVRREIEQVKTEKNQQLDEQKRKFEEEINKATIEINQIKLQHHSEIFSLLPFGQFDYETSKVCDGEFKNLFDNSQETLFRLDNIAGGYIIFDFRNKKIMLQKYYFSVPSKSWWDGRPKSWRIEGSNDKIQWNLIDSRENDPSLNEYGHSNKFKCTNASNSYFRYIRIKEIISHNNNHNFLLSEIEFSGSIM